MKKKIIISSEQLDYVASTIAHYTGELDKIDVHIIENDTTIDIELIAAKSDNLWKIRAVNVRCDVDVEIINIEELQQTSKDAFRFLASKRYESGIKHSVAK